VSWNKDISSKDKWMIRRRFVIVALLNILLIAIGYSLATANISTPGLDVLLGKEVSTEFDFSDEDSIGFDLFNIQANNVPVCIGDLVEYQDIVLGINIALLTSFRDAIGNAAVASQNDPGTIEYNNAIANYSEAINSFNTIAEDWDAIDHPSCLTLPLVNDATIIGSWQESFDGYVRAAQNYVVMIGARDQGNAELVSEAFNTYTSEQTAAEWNNGFFFGQMFLLFELQNVEEV